MKKKKWIVTGVIVLTGLAVLAGVTVFFIRKNKDKEIQETPQMPEAGGDLIRATGLTSVGMNTETLKLDFLTTELYVEESYLSAGDEVEAGTKVFKISDETLHAAKQELEDKVTETDLAYRQGLIDYENDLLEAEDTYKKASIEAEYAQTVYDQAAADAKKTVEDLEEQVEEARELVEEYQKSESEDYYRSYYQVDELYAAYYEHFNLLMSFYEKWDIEMLNDLYGKSASSLSLSSITGSSSSSVASTGTADTTSSEIQGTVDAGEAASPDMAQAGSFSLTGGSGVGGNFDTGSSSDSGESEKLSVYNLLDELVTEEGKEYQTALENYEKARDQASAGLKKAESDLADLEAQLASAQTEYETSLISSKADYDVTLSENENADLIYETTKQSLEETLEGLKDEKEEAEENQESFLEALSDGYFYTEKAGTVVVSAVAADSYLSGDTLAIAYSNPETVTITAQVDQSDIAKISIGEEAYIMVSGYGNYEGSVTMLNPVTQADSRTSVTYQVTVTLSGDVINLTSNLTAYVYFGDVESMKNMQMPDTTAPDGENGEGFTIPDGENGEGFTMPDGENGGNFTIPDGESGEGFTMPDRGDGEDFAPPGGEQNTSQ